MKIKVKNANQKQKVNVLANKQGITLIALVVTIVVLLILAGITINFVLAEGGLFDRARDAENTWEQAVQNDLDSINALTGEIDKYLNNEGDSSGGSGENTGGNEEEPEPSSLAKLIGQSASDTNQTVYDEYNNKVVVPAGFTVVAHSEGNSSTDVTYGYTGNTSSPAVQDGIVIQDEDGNQFVWVPVGEINNKQGDANGETTTITLGRYDFAADGTSSTYSGSYVEEDATDTENLKNYGNTIAININEFISKTNANGGYYIARYEASKGSNGKVNSQSAAVWNNITQPAAATAAKTMYEENNNFISDLVNSYAWDTAIVFIQKYSGDSDYSRQNSLNTSLANTGTIGDKVCNIYDMASNTREWTTETSTTADAPCVYRGGRYYNSIHYTGSRVYFGASYSDDNSSFRPLLYVKQ